MSFRLAVVLLFGWLIAAAALARAQAQPEPISSPASLPYCAPYVAVLERLVETPDPRRNFVIALRTRGTVGMAVSGTLALYVGDDRYVAAFHDAVAVGGEALTNGSTPVVVSFPAAVHVDAAYVASLEAPTSEPCAVGNVWGFDPPLANNTPDPEITPQPFDLAAFQQKALSMPRSPAKLASHEIHPNCEHPDALPSPIHLAVPNFPRRTPRREYGIYKLAVTQGPRGTIIDAYVLRGPAPTSRLAEEAMRVARASTFSQGMFRCQPVSGMYKFTVDFQGDEGNLRVR